MFAYDQQKSFISFLALGALGNIILNYLLIPKYGIEGSAIATLGAQILSTGFIWLKMKKINNFKTLPYLKNIVLAATIMSFITFVLKYLSMNLFLNVTISALSYFCVLILLKEPLIKDIKGAIKIQTT